MKQLLLPVALLTVMMSCKNNESGSTATADSSRITLITLDPGHFHAALVQKEMYPDVDSNVYVYAPEGPDVGLHLKRIESYNTRAANPTHWKENVYTGSDFFQKMIAERKGNVVVMSGNNQKKAEYVLNTVDAGLNVLADKPMAIDKAGFELVKNAFSKAAEKKVLLYDIMTERFEINTLLQREFSQIKAVFGDLEKARLKTLLLPKKACITSINWFPGRYYSARPGSWM